MTDIAALLSDLDETITVLTGTDVSERYQVDWTFVDECRPDAVLLPTSTEEVSAIMQKCNTSGQPVVIQGGLTGLAGGATPNTGELAISLEKLNGIEEIDEDALTMTVKAGTPLQDVQQAALERGLIFPMDLGARGTATIGGNVSTNAGGIQVIRYGMTRSLIMGLEVVLADGTIITSLNKMLKNNAGYDLKHLFIGAEGTLGVVTRVVLRLFPKPKSRCTALVAFTDFADSIKLLKNLQANLVGLVNSYEVMWDNYYEQVEPTLTAFKNPFDEKHGAYAIVELRGNHQQQDATLMEYFLNEQLQTGLLSDAVIAQSETEADNIWTLRHGLGDLGSSVPLINYDVSIPVGDMDQFTKALMNTLNSRYPHITTLLFGHLGDSNLHVVISHYEPREFKALKDVVHVLTGEYGGSVSAEHGIGKLKSMYLPLSRTAEELALMRLLKKAMDPNGILNGGRVIG